ncbi:MAG: hypothetical protein ACLSUW_03205 [Akkermansia sp.]
MGIVDYPHSQAGLVRYRNALRIFLRSGLWRTPAQVKLSADKKVINPADGTDDVHVTVVADAAEADIQCRR